MRKLLESGNRGFLQRGSEPGETDAFTKVYWPMRLLVVEDDDRLRDVVRRGLEEQGHVVDLAADGRLGEALGLQGDFDAIILDLNLPGLDGLSVLRSLRAARVGTPVVILTSRDTTDDIVDGLDAGADDYMRKPFVFRELEARLRSISRREGVPSAATIVVEDVIFDVQSRRVTRGDVELAFTARELVFLEYFMRNVGRVLTRRMMEAALWDSLSETNSNVVDVYVRRLRVKLDASGPPLLHTVRGIGYRMGAR